MKLTDIKPVSEMGKKLLRTLFEIEEKNIKYGQYEIIYNFHYPSANLNDKEPNYYHTTTTIDKPRKSLENYSVFNPMQEEVEKLKCTLENIKNNKKKEENSDIEDDNLIFGDVKEKTVKPIAKPDSNKVKVEKPKTEIENELLSIFCAKRLEPENTKSKSFEPPLKKSIKEISSGGNEYMECYPVAEEYAEIGETPDFVEKVKEYFNSEEQQNEDRKWEAEGRKNFLFGGSSAGMSKKGHGLKKKGNQKDKVEKVFF